MHSGLALHNKLGSTQPVPDQQLNWFGKHSTVFYQGKKKKRYNKSVLLKRRKQNVSFFRKCSI